MENSVHRILVDYAFTEMKLNFNSMHEMVMMDYPDLHTYITIQNAHWERGMELLKFLKNLGHLEDQGINNTYGPTGTFS